MSPSAATRLESAPAPSSATPVTTNEIVLRKVRLLARRRLLWVEQLRDGGLAPAGVIASRDLTLALDNLDNPAAELAFRASRPELRAIEQELESIARTLAADNGSTLARLCSTFELAPHERDVLEVCLASALEPALGKVWATLHHHPSQNYPSEPLIARLSGDGRAALLTRSGALLRWEIVRSGEASSGDPAPLELDAHIFEYLCGRAGADPVLADGLSVLSAEQAPESWPVEETCERIRNVLAQGHGARVIILGPRNSGRRTFAAAVSDVLGGQALGVDTTAIDADAWPRVHLRAQRQALLCGGTLTWWGGEVERRFPSGPGLARLQFVIGEGELSVGALPGIIDLRVTMPRISLDERRTLWRRLLPATQTWPAHELDHVVERYHVQIGDIAEIARRGIDRIDGVRAACRSLTRDRLGELGGLVDCPFGREDLLLPQKLDQLLDEFLFEARERVRFWEKPEARRLFPRGTGLIALMTGTPGTGKTMAAQVIARELDLDLFRVDLASSVSKYIGETAKNLRKIFVRAREMNAVLLFDEADALFSKRTEVRDSHDRYANADTNYLLQLLEDHDGIALLASNKRQNIDTAFVRRIRYMLDFPRPTARERLLIWRRLVTELVSAERASELDVLLTAISESADLSGAQIKLALLAAIFVARQERQTLGRDHLLRGIERELGKESRSLTPKERERIEHA